MRVILSILAVSTILAGTASAQVSPPSADYRDPFTGLTPGSSSLPTATPVQRQYVSATTNKSVSDEVLYIDPSNPAPSNLADGISDYNASAMDRTATQLRGDYGDSRRDMMPSGLAQEAWSRPFEAMSQGQVTPGVARFSWTADLIMPIQVGEATGSSIVFPDWEIIEEVLIIDGQAIEAQITRPNVIDLRTVQVGRDTSVKIISESGNLYTFYVRSTGRNAEKLSDVQVFVEAPISKGSSNWFRDQSKSSFSRSGGAGVSDNPALSNTRHDASDAHPMSVSNGAEAVPQDRRFFEHRMFEVKDGDSEIAPEYVMHDGRFTYLTFAAGVTDKPAVFRVVDGKEGRVNTRTIGRFGETVVIEAMGDFVLRSGGRAVCIVHEPKSVSAEK